MKETASLEETSNLAIFAEYFIPTIIFVAIMLNRIALLDILLRFIEYLFVPILKMVTRANEWIRATIDKIESQEFVFFTRGDNLSNLNKVMLYIQGNEHTRKIKIVTVSKNLDNEVIEKTREGYRISRSRIPGNRDRVRQHQGRIRAGIDPGTVKTMEHPGQFHVHRLSRRSLSLTGLRNLAASG